MNWDLVLALSGWALNLSAFTTLLNKKAVVPYTHSGLVVLSLVAVIVAYFNMGLLDATIANAVGLAIWVGIALRRGPREVENPLERD